MRSCVLVVALLCVSLAAGCQKQKSQNLLGEPPVFFQDDLLGYKVRDCSFWFVEPEDRGDGRAGRQASGLVEIRGQGTHRVSVTQDDTGQGAASQITVRDEDANNERTFQYEYGTGWTTITNPATNIQVIIDREPDGSYLYNGERVGTGKAAADALRSEEVFTGASTWGLIMAYAVASSGMTTSSDCIRSSPDGCVPNIKDRKPIVCVQNQEFCNCALCYKLGMMTGCPRCQ